MSMQNRKGNSAALRLSEQQIILLQPKEWDEFVRMLDEPAEPTPALKALMARKPPWEEASEEPEGST